MAVKAKCEFKQLATFNKNQNSHQKLLENNYFQEN